MIRIAREPDAVAVVDIYRPFVEASATSFETEVPTPEAMWARMAATLLRTPWLVWEEADRVVGYAYAGPHRTRAAYQWCVESSVYMAEGHRRGGRARRLYGALLEILALQGFQNAYAGITLPNEPSVRFHESLGFELVGVYRNIGHKFGRWHDVGWWARAVATPPPPSPESPRGFDAFVGDPRLAVILAKHESAHGVPPT